MTEDLFARAKGPRADLPDTETVICPWCHSDCSDAEAAWREAVHRYVSACTECGKEFMFPDVDGEFVCVGLLSPPDMKYLASKEKPHAA